MPLLEVVRVVVDRSLAARLIKELAQLYAEGLLKEWEEGFALKMQKLSVGARLSVKQAAKLLQILQERRKRTECDGASLRGMMAILLENRKYLGKDDREIVDEFWRRGCDYMQLDEFNHVHLMARRQELSFPTITRRNFQLNRRDLAEATRLAREDLKLALARRRASKRTRVAQALVGGRSGCGNDLSPVLRALGALEQAMSR